MGTVWSETEPELAVFLPASETLNTEKKSGVANVMVLYDLNSQMQIPLTECNWQIPKANSMLLADFVVSSS